MTKEQTDRLDLLSHLGFALVVSQPRPEVDRETPWIAWDVELTYKGKTVLKTPYKKGVGHVDPTKAKPDAMFRNWTDNEKSFLYTWSRPVNRHANFKNKALQAQIAAKLAKQQEVKPELDEVVSCLLMDGEAFFQAQSFEDWATDFGYDKDSRSAEAIYRTCDATGRKLANAVPGDVLKQAKEIIKDL